MRLTDFKAKEAMWNWDAGKPKKCQFCGKEYQPKSRTQKFCSKECREASHER